MSIISRLSKWSKKVKKDCHLDFSNAVFTVCEETAQNNVSSKLFPL